jgi:acetolactate synthase-1/2/3 large subunit
MVRNVAELPKRIKEAFEIATSGRLSPVLVGLPKDVTAAILRKAIPMSSTLPSLPSQASKVAQDVTKRHSQSAIKRVADLINIAEASHLCGPGCDIHP